MRQFLLAALGLALPVLPLSAQTLNLNMTTDSLVVTGPWTETRDIVFSNRQNAYTAGVMRYGIQFRNGLDNAMPNNVSIGNLQGSPIIGAHGPGTIVRYQGTFKSDQGQSIPSVALTNGGRFVIDSAASVDFVLDGAYFTRQFWIMGDGTGTFEFAHGFIADLSQNGTVPNGLGSIRLSNTILETHDTRSLPKTFRPDPSGSAKLNAHLVFENAPGSIWRSLTEPQDYQGGLWVHKDMSIDAQTPLTISGVITSWPDYTNHGGVMFRDSNVTVTKTGPAELIFTGDQAYNRHSLISVQEGALELHTNPYVPAITAFNNGQNLTIGVGGSGTLHLVNTDATLEELIMLTGATLRLDGQKTLTANETSYAGTLDVYFQDGITLSAGQSFQIINTPASSGQFVTVNVPDYGGAITWDLSQLYTTGTISIASGTVVTGVKTAAPALTVQAWPNPCTSQLLADLPAGEANLQFVAIDALGRQHPLQARLQRNDSRRQYWFSTRQLPAGRYSLQAVGGSQPLKPFVFVKE